MSHSMPSPQEARAAVAEAARYARGLRRADRRFRLVLLIIAAMYVAVGLLAGLPRVEQPAVIPRFGLPIVLGGGLVACIFLLLPMRAASRSGSARYNGSIAAFSIWNGLVVSVSTATGWWGAGQSGLHFTASAVVAAVPLLVGAWLVGWNRR